MKPPRSRRRPATDTCSRGPRKPVRLFGTYTWIGPSGEVLWSTTWEQNRREAEPYDDFALTRPLASIGGILVLRSINDSRFVGIAPDGSIAWTQEIPAYGGTYNWHHDEAGVLDQFELPTVLTLDVSDAIGGGFAAYDPTTGAQLSTFDVGPLYMESDVLGADLFLWRDWVVWQNPGTDRAMCEVHGQSISNGVTWQQSIRCLTPGSTASNGWIRSDRASQGEGSVLVNIQSGQTLSDPAYSMNTLYDAAGSNLLAVSLQSDDVVAYGIDDGAELWTAHVADSTEATINAGLVAVTRTIRYPNASPTEVNAVTVPDASTGAPSGTFRLPDGAIDSVTAISATSVFVIGADFVGLYTKE